MTVLRDGDYRPDGRGGLEQASGAQAVLEQALFLLTARRGGFPLLPEVGSRLYELPRAKPADRGALGAAYAAQALAALPELEVRGADWDEGTGTLTVRLHWRGTDLGLTVPVA